MEPIVIDHGSFHIRAGYGNPDNDPTMVVSSEVCQVGGDISEGDAAACLSRSSSYTGDELSVRNPIDRGQIKDWDVMEDVWRYILYDQLGWEIGNEGQVLVAEALNTPKNSRETMTQILFENFNCGGLFTAEQSLLSLYAMGKLTGCTVDIGHGKTEIVPIVEGAVQYSASRVLPMGVMDLDALLAKELSQKYPDIKFDSHLVIAIRENCCSVPLESSEEMREKVEYTLPDGQVISVGDERFQVPESFFDPLLLGIEASGLGEQIIQSLGQSGLQEQFKNLLDNVVLVGGGSLISGFEERFTKDIASYGPASSKPTLIRPPEYMPDTTVKNAAWLGGAILSKIVFTQNQFVAKTDYDEWGPGIVHRKCS